MQRLEEKALGCAHGLGFCPLPDLVKKASVPASGDFPWEPGVPAVIHVTFPLFRAQVQQRESALTQAGGVDLCTVCS